MRTLVDNTTIHRVFGALRESTTHQPIRRIDVLALLHFAEHIMFTDELEVSTFESPAIHDTTARAVDLLLHHGIANSTADGFRVFRVPFTDSQYADACDEAVPHILEDLQVAGAKKLGFIAKKIDQASRPFGAAESPVAKWLERDWSQHEREDLIASALDLKAVGAFDYVIAKNPAVYAQLRHLSRSDAKKRSQATLARAVHVLMRIGINEQLGHQLGSVYSPAPQRAQAAQEIDMIFRHEVARLLTDEIDKSARGFASRLIAKMTAQERVPLPIFAIHFLRPKRAGSPLALLDAARQLRDDPEVTDVRSWLGDWERYQASGDEKEIQKARRRLDSIAQDLRVTLHGVPWFSALRGNVVPSPDGSSLEVQPDLGVISDLLRKAGTVFLRRQKFLALLSDEFSTDAKIGADLNRLLQRAIVD